MYMYMQVYIYIYIYTYIHTYHTQLPGQPGNGEQAPVVTHMSIRNPL